MKAFVTVLFFMLFALSAVAKTWRVCALLPHAKDRYWWGIAYGLKDEASKTGVKLEIFLADGYNFLEQQKKQIRQCQAQKFDAMILGGISRDQLSMTLEEVRLAGIPVVDLVNGVNSSAIVAKATVNYLKVTDKIFDFILKHAHANKIKKPLRIVVFPGPKGAGWSEDTYSGFKAKSRQKDVRITFGGFDDTGIYQQMSLVRDYFRDSDADYVVANGVAALAASRYFQYKKNHKAPYIISTYETDEIIDALRVGNILATSTERPVVLARQGIHLAIEAAENKLNQSQFQGDIDVATKENIDKAPLEKSLPGRGFFFESDILNREKK